MGQRYSTSLTNLKNPNHWTKTNALYANGYLYSHNRNFYGFLFY